MRESLEGQGEEEIEIELENNEERRGRGVRIVKPVTRVPSQSKEIRGKRRDDMMAQELWGGKWAQEKRYAL